MTAQIFQLHPERSCVIRDPSLLHQLTMEGSLRRTTVRGVCNCGATFPRRDPRKAGTLPSTFANYRLHLALAGAS